MRTRTHARTNTDTHETHFSSFAQIIVSSHPLLLFSQLAYAHAGCGSQERPSPYTTLSPYAGSYHVPSATKAAQHFSEVQQVEESSSGKKLCKVELEKASVDLATSGDVIKQLQQTLQDKHSPP